MDAVDRRLITRNRFQNSANTFDGVRFRVGDEKSPWGANFFVTRPVEPNRGSFDDRSRKERSFYGAYANFLANSPDVVIEPCYFYSDGDRHAAGGRHRTLHTVGVHAYGQFGNDSFDYHLIGVVQ